MTVTQTLKRIEVIPEDKYEAVLFSVDESQKEGEHGPMWFWSFMISSGEYEGVEVTAISSQTYSTYPSKSYKWAMTLGHPADIDFDAELIQNRPCRIRVIVVEKDGGERNRVEAVGAPTKAQLEAEPPTSEEIPF